MLAGAITQGEVTVTNVLPEPQTALVSKLRETGITVDEGEVSGGTEEAGRERDLGEVIPPAEPPSNQASGGCGK